jgi:hypothetical protein
MVMSVAAHELALAKTHVRLVRQHRGGVSKSVRSNAAPTNMGKPDESIEIRDLGWIVETA